jgi:phosphoglycolate phosphatase-like HAD superfamily hydrolase
MREPGGRTPLSRYLTIGLTALICWGVSQAHSADALPSWNDGAAKSAIVGFVEAVITDGGPDYVPPDERIAAFDNDGTLWVEQPYYTLLAFALDRIRALAPEHPEWREQQPFKAVLENDLEALKASGIKGVMQLVMASHAGMTTEEFETIVEDWIGSSEHPKFARPYTELVYQPMLELLAYLRDNGFKTFIVSGGGVEFMRPWTEQVYGIPPEQVVGSTILTEFALRDDVPVLVRRPEMDFLDDKEGKPVAINKFVGRQPIFAAGNSDGDLQMLQWTTGTEGRRLGLIVHHDDAEREYAYDGYSHVGHLDEALDQAEARGWVVVSMKSDWNTVIEGGAE